MTEIISLKTQQDSLKFNANTGQLISFCSKFAEDQEFIASQVEDPVFVIQYLDHPLEGTARFCQLTSQQAQKINISVSELDQVSVLTAKYRQLSGFDMDVVVTVKTSPSDPFSHWSLEIDNQTDLFITDIQFPYVVVPYHLQEVGKVTGSEALLYPFGAGVLLKEPQPHQLPPDHPNHWQLRPENWDSGHYPGATVAQFMAYYNDRAGLYMACLDTEGSVKLIKPVHHNPHIRLGFCHIGDWSGNNRRVSLGYEIVLGSFQGDWYTAADIYRDWALQQPWARTPLHARKDVPAWLLESPPHIILRIQGILDAGPATPNPEFIPYPKIIPMLEAISKRIEAPLVPVIMSWERPGPWVYPDCFPPAGGEESLKEFSDMARARGWHVGSFCNGTRWVTGHFWSGYDGEDYFIEQDGASTVSKSFNGALWKEKWDETWRPSYPACMGVERTRLIARDFIQKLLDCGLDWVQFLDQNCGAATFPCYASDHEHDPVPGKWMTDKMSTLTGIFRQLGEETFQKSDAKRHVAFSAEMAVNEVFLQDFQICDIRVIPPGHSDPSSLGFVPLYHYLYHEFIITQGGFGLGPEPFHLQIRNAYNWVIGEIPGAVMKGDGQLLAIDTGNWAPWEPQVGSNDDALQMLHATCVLRRGAAKDYLVFGRMMRPVKVEGIKTVRWQNNGRDHQIPAVFHSAWQSPGGRFAVTLVNWTNDVQIVKLSDSRLGKKLTQTLACPLRQTDIVLLDGSSLEIELPALSCVLLEA